jgi:hypothetical protein
MRDVVALLGFALGLSCQDPAAPPTGSMSSGSGSGSAMRAGSAGSGSGSAGSGTAQASDLGSGSAATPPEPGRVTLPRTGDEPPRKTTKPLARAELERLAGIEFKDFHRQDRGVHERFTEFRHVTTTRPILGVTITIEPCARAEPRRASRPVARKRANAATPGHVCTPMQLELWKARTDELKQSLSKQLIARPETLFEVGTRDVLGTPAIYTYQLAAFFGTDETGQPVGAYSDAYILYYNDGVNEIRVNAAYIDDAVGGTDKLLAIAPREDLEKLAVSFMRYYLHEWR